MKARELKLKEEHGDYLVTIFKNFFTPLERWGRLNRSQLIMGSECTSVYLLVNILFRNVNLNWNPFSNSSPGLMAAVLISIGITLANLFINPSRHFPWFEKYLPKIITIMGLITLIAIQNLNSKGIDDIGLWMNIVFLLVLFIIMAGYFVEGISSERIIKVWFSLLGYFFSVIGFFYLLEILFSYS
ncbi:MAG TPA: hypothetical protein VMT35_09390 [Ignavibacteriaceae bacterium]|nr:hypothetical protein [Ignavibacteriaceae bacterium]